MKKILSVLLTLSILLSTIGYSAFAKGFEVTYEDFDPTCKAYSMINMENGEIVYNNNADERLPMASLTKIMSFIVAYENIPSIETAKTTMTQEVQDILNATGSSLSGIEVGEELTILQLFNLMLVPSGNDASMIIEEYYNNLMGYTAPFTGEDDEGVDNRAYDMTGSPFITLMNEKAKELGCEDTNFTNSHGLHHENHYTTANDFAIITHYATTLPYFSEITAQTSYTLPPTNMNDDTRTVVTTNGLLTEFYAQGTLSYYYTYATGIKTGSHSQAGYCLAASASYEGYSYIVIALGAPMRDADGNIIDENASMKDTANLFRWAFLNLSYQNVITEGTLLGDVDVEYSWEAERLQLVAEDNLKILLPNDTTVSELEYKPNIPETIQAPISQGDLVGSVSVLYNGEEVGKVNLVSPQSIGRNPIAQTLEVSMDFITSPIFVVIIVIAIIVLILYLALSIAYNKRKKKIDKLSRRRRANTRFRK